MSWPSVRAVLLQWLLVLFNFSKGHIFSIPVSVFDVVEVRLEIMICNLPFIPGLVELFSDDGPNWVYTLGL